MTDHDALLRSVLEHPHDDLPRLVYADWLDDAGEVDRAEFVRCQVELSEIDREVTAGKRLGGYCPASPELMKGECPCSWHRLRRRERDLLEAHEWDWLHAIHPELQRGSHDASTGRTWWLRKPVWSRGFLKSLEIDWETFREIHAGLFWSPRQTVECDNCEGAGEFTRENSDPPYGPCPNCGGRLWSGPYLHPDDHGWDKGTGRKGPRPFVPTAQPLETVLFSSVEVHVGEYDEDENGNWIMLPMESGVATFNRVKCPTCDDMSLRAGETDAPDLVRECPSCRGTPPNRWACPEWPGLEFVMPEMNNRRV